MKRLMFGLVTCFTIVLAGCSSSSTSGTGATDGKGGPSGDGRGSGGGAKIVGKWEASEPSAEMPAGAVMEFTGDGKVVMHMDAKGKEVTIPAGAYKLDGDKLTVTSSFGGKESTETNKIKLTDDSLTITEAKGKEIKLKRKK
jgi:uncharacterized protein (TIGR03066 family)